MPGPILTPVRNSNKLTVLHKDPTGLKTNSEQFKFALSISEINSDTAVALDTWARGFVALSKDTYSDCELKTTKCIESIAGGNS